MGSCYMMVSAKQTSYSNDPEAGRASFFRILENSPDNFEKANKQMSTVWKKGRGQNVPDHELAETLITLFIQTCSTPAEGVIVSEFLREEIQARLKQKHKEIYLQQTSEASAVLQILSEAVRGDIRRTHKEIEQQQALALQGERKFNTLKEDPKAKETLYKASVVALFILHCTQKIDRSQFDDKSKHWDFSKHSFVEGVSLKDERHKVERDLHMYALSSFVEMLVANEEDQAAVEAYLRGKFLSRICCSKGMYIHYAHHLSLSIDREARKFFYELSKSVCPNVPRLAQPINQDPIKRTEQENQHHNMLAREGKRILNELKNDPKKKEAFDKVLTETFALLDRNIDESQFETHRWDLSKHEFVECIREKTSEEVRRYEAEQAERDLNVLALSQFVKRLFPDDIPAVKAHLADEFFEDWGCSDEAFIHSGGPSIGPRIKFVLSKNL